MNQCDGCQRRLPINDGWHYNPDNAWDTIQCTASKYECKVPPKGWYCSRGAGHDGPCAARPTLEGLMRENGVEHECSVCPSEIRNLYAVAHNFVTAYDRGMVSWCRVAFKIDRLREAVKALEPLVEKHFEDSRRVNE